MKLLLHICCAPCLAYPLDVLIKKGHEVTGYFSNDNIHPFTEYKKRLDTLKDYSKKAALQVIYNDSYDIKKFLQKVAFNEDKAKRCELCYIMRLESAAIEAVKRGCEAFSSTILYSKYQNHELVKQIGVDLSKKYGIIFYYEDFRVGWGEGIRLSKELGMYRQSYCGCIYSERERYFKLGDKPV